jgi:hypothetical protein
VGFTAPLAAFFTSPRFLHLTYSHNNKMVKQIGNPYFIAAIAVIGGGLFGFDISSMSAIIATQVCVEALM